METNRRTLTPVTTRRGRPRAAMKEPGVRLTTWIPESRYDELVRLASARREPLSSVTRSLLILRLPAGEDSI